MNEYNPWRSTTHLARPCRRIMGGKGDAYLDWLVGAVKPLIDRSFPTRAEREATGIIGSSMGGLISALRALRPACSVRPGRGDEPICGSE